MRRLQLGGAISRRFITASKRQSTQVNCRKSRLLRIDSLLTIIPVIGFRRQIRVTREGDSSRNGIIRNKRQFS